MRVASRKKTEAPVAPKRGEAARRRIGAAAVIFAVSVGAAAQGTSVWSGVYTEEQAKRGEAVSNKLCTSCHGPDLSGGEAGPTLVGLEFVGNWNNLTVADFFDRVQATMPADAPGTMTPQQTSDVTAYVFKLNKYPAGQAELPTDLAALKGIKIEGEQPAK
jgi:mono/diheme cytochrome c family protein